MGNVLANLERKSTQADEMFSQLVAYMNQARDIEIRNYDQEIEVPTWLAS